MRENPRFTYDAGGVIRADRKKRALALVFTGGYVSEELPRILDTFKAHDVKGSFYFIGDFLRTPDFHDDIRRIVDEGHLLGPHSDHHPQLVSWDRKETLVKKADLFRDLDGNFRALAPFGVRKEQISHWIVPFEIYTQEVAAWCEEYGCRIFNYTPGTLSNSDWMEDDNKNFVPTDRIYASILEAERKDPDGLSGFFLLMHVGAGPKRTDKGMRRFTELVSHLKAGGYKMATVEELLTPKEDEK